MTPASSAASASRGERLRVAVFGVGAVGGYFGGRLLEAGHEVAFIARGATLEALRTRGLRIESIHGDFRAHPVEATESPEAVGTADLVLLAVKAWQVGAVAPLLRPMLGDRGAVLPLQNGVEAADQLAETVGRAHVLGGVCKILCFQIGPAHLRHTGVEPWVALGELDNRVSRRVERVRDALARAGVAVEVPASIQEATWAKFLLIGPVSGLGAATRVSLGELRSDSATRRLLEEAMREVRAVAAATGVALSGTLVDETMDFVDSLPAEGTASMQRDIMDGVPSELESQTGAVVRLGREHGVEVPVNSMLYALLSPLERRARNLETAGR